MSVEDYLQQAAHNRQVAEVLSRGDPISLQWAVICVFYAGLHYVNAYLYHVEQRAPRTHRDRNERIAQLMKPVYRAYRGLRTGSEWARYELFQPTGTDYQTSCQKVDEIQQFVNKCVAH